MFPFGFSFNEILFVAAALGIAGGKLRRSSYHNAAGTLQGVRWPHDFGSLAGYRESMLRFSRSGGVYVGRVIGVIRQKREQILSGSNQAEVKALRAQLSDAMQQMHSIRYEVAGVARMSPCATACLASADDVWQLFVIVDIMAQYHNTVTVCTTVICTEQFAVVHVTCSARSARKSDIFHFT
jgi:hypothetical protein